MTQGAEPSLSFHGSHILDESIDYKIKQELINLFFVGAIKANVFVLIASVTIFFAFQSTVPSFPLIVWTSLMILLSTIRLFISYHFNRTARSGKNRKIYICFYYTLTTITGICWSLLAVLPNVAGNIYAHTALLVIMTAIISVSTNTLAADRLVQTLYISPFPLVVAYSFIISSSPWSMQFAIIPVMFWLFMLSVGKQQHDTLVQNLRLHFDNQKLINQLERSNEKEKLANQAKSQFLANMSHEIRTPMNSIIGRTCLALENKVDQETRSHLEMISSSADNLLALINDILDFSKIEAGELRIENKPFDLLETVDSCLKTIHVLLEDKDKGIVLKSNISPAVPRAVKGDPLRIRQILINLLSNSVKFTDAGSIELVVDLVQTDNDSLDIQFIVKDTGIGIAADKLEHIFDKFSQENDSTARIFGGTGLGLSISRQLCQLMGGSIEAVSSQGTGATFIFTLCLQSYDSSGLPDIKEEENHNLLPISSLSLLLVEDNEPNRILARMVLEKQKHTITEAHDGLTALKLLARQDFDAVLMDVQMPTMDGLTATRIIRNAECGMPIKGVNEDLAVQLATRLSGGHIPVIALTANAMSEDREKCLAAGMDDYLSKPFKLGAIATVLGTLVVGHLTQKKLDTLSSG